MDVLGLLWYVFFFSLFFFLFVLSFMGFTLRFPLLRWGNWDQREREGRGEG